MFSRLSLRRDEGASAVEYGLLLAGIATVIIATVFAFGIMVNKTITSSTDCLAKGFNHNATQC